MKVSIRSQVDQKVSKSHTRVHTCVNLQNVAGTLQRELWEVTEELLEGERERSSTRSRFYICEMATFWLSSSN